MMHESGISSPVKPSGVKKGVGRAERLCKRGTLLFIEGEPGAEMFVIRSGKIRLLKHEGETSVVTAEAGPGSVIGEMSLLKGEPRTVTAQVMEDSVVMPIDGETYAATLKNIPSWLGGALRSLVKRLVDTLAQSGKEVEQKGIAGVIRVLLLLALGRDSRVDAVSLGSLKETLYSLTGLGDAEMENIFLHLILKRMLSISRDDTGQEYVRIKNPEVLRLYLAFLRAQQSGEPFPGENAPPAVFDLTGTWLPIFKEEVKL
jgi:CRP-like cAMP-binding protein